MNENTVSENSAVETTTDAFLEGWEDAPVSAEPADPQAEATDNEATPKESESAAPAADTPTADSAVTETPSAIEPSWELNYMGERKTMTAKEVTPELLQKALDYDRVRGKYDESKPVMDMFTQFAKQANMSVPDYVKFIRQQTKMSGDNGMTAEEAKRAVELEDREAAVAAKEAEQNEAEQAKRDSEARVQADLREFSKAFPEIYNQAKNDPKAIPDEVWADVNSGSLTLTAAYSKYAVAKAQREAAAAAKVAETTKQNESNAARSTGSMKSAGSDAQGKDPFLNGWDSLD